VYGLLGRALVPELYVTGDTDAVVLRLPEIAWPGLGGELLGALVAAGAFAAFMSTASGLLVSLAGTLSFDLWGRHERSAARRRIAFRVAAVAAMVVPAVLALGARGLDISLLVGWAFAVAASTFCPLLLLGIWWGRLTTAGAAAGMIVGGSVATACILAGLVAGDGGGEVLDALLAQPAALSVPLAFTTMIGVSVRGRRRLDWRTQMLALHGPEGLGLEELGLGRRGT
jgi:Na+(H+)/acetate symporter ActP